MVALVFERLLLPAGWARNARVEIADRRIAAIEPDAQAEPGDERHAIGLPGLPNVHSHAFQRGMAGLAEVRGHHTDTFWTWREVMYRFALAMTPEDVEAVAAQAYVEMLESGFTRVGEFHYLHHDRDGRPYTDIAELAGRIVAAATDSGIGLTLLPVLYAHSTFGGAPPHQGQRRFICDRDSYAELLAASRRHAAAGHGVNVGIAPHSLRAVTPDELAAITALAGDGPVHIHVAEQIKEVEDCLAWSGKRPVEWLLDFAAARTSVPLQRWCFIHATHMTPDETRRMAAAGVVAGLCPITEASLGDGIFNGPEFVAAGGRFAIGTDSNVLIGAADELRQLEYAQRLRLRQRNVMSGGAETSTGRTLYAAALAGGAHALDVPVAGLTIGASADIVSLDATHPALIGRTEDAVIDALVFATRGSAIDCVWVAGAKRVAGGRHRARERIAQRFRAAVLRLGA